MHDSFELVWEKDVPELESKALLFTHKRTKAQALVMENQDEDKVFAIGFRTIPQTSNGVAHILEHAVLNGSKKYPVKEPFVHLIKSSVSSFVNAFTSQEYTVYPVSSPNEVDFYNVMGVYLDAVFDPLITEKIFQQEGWHYELDPDAKKLSYGGVVFNEMKGSMASEGSRNWYEIKKALFPDTFLAKNSGGEPAEIPNLTYEDFKQFHQKHYHPSNSQSFFWGNGDTQQHLAKLAEYLDSFDYRKVDLPVVKQVPFSVPKKVETTYAASDAKAGCYAQVAWGLDLSDPLELMKWWVLDSILTGSDASPMRKALTESNLGEGLAGWGVVTGLSHEIYQMGLKGVEKQNTEKVHELVMSTFEEIAKGIDPKVVEAALSMAEFDFREVSGGDSAGLQVFEWVIDSWFIGREPLNIAQFDHLIKKVRQEYKEDPDMFSKIVRDQLLENPFRIDFVMCPDSELVKANDDLEAQRLDKVLAGLDDAAKQKIQQQSMERQKWQDTPDSDEQIAKIPRLEVADLDKQYKIIHREEAVVEDANIMLHDLPTRGIAYFAMAFDISWLQPDDYPILSVFKGLLTRLGTDAKTYEELAVEIDTVTGGVGASTSVGRVLESTEEVSLLVVKGKAFSRNQAQLVDLIRQVVLDTNFDNKERVRQLLQQRKKGYESNIVRSGSGLALDRASSWLEKSEYVTERMYGIEFLFWLRDLLQNFDDRWPALLEEFKKLQTKLAESLAVMNYTSSKQGWQDMQSELAKQVKHFTLSVEKQKLPEPELLRANEAFVIPAEVNYVAAAADLAAAGYKLHGSIAVIKNIIGRDYLWNKVRVKGGAYGCYFYIDEETCVGGFSSYRDPNIANTIKAYREAGEYLTATDFSKSHLDGAIIGAIGSLDKPISAAAKGYRSFYDKLYGWTDERLQQYRDELLSTSVKDIKFFGEVLLKATKPQNTSVTILGNNTKIGEYARQTEGLLIRPLL